MPRTSARAVGARVPRVEDERLLTGQGRFVADVQLPGSLHACFVRSPYARARILGVDADEARALPGVHAVFVAADLLPDVHEQWHTLTGPDAVEAPRPPLADGEVRFVGDPVALVLAENPYLAEDATELVYVDYEPQPPAVDYTAAANAADAAEAPEATVHAAFPDNVMGGVTGEGQDEVDAAFAAAPHVVAATIRQHAHVPAPMETRGLVAHWQRGELTVHAATQSPHEFRSFFARLLGVPEHRVRVIMRDTGGAFGQKIFVQREDMAIVLAARKVPAPVTWIEDRRENLLAAGQSRREHGDARLAFDDDGRILAARLDVVQDVGAYPTPAPINSAALIGRLFPGPYRVPAGTFTSRSVCSNTVGRSAYRGPWEFETLAREVLLDIAARQLGIDPVELRRRNLLRRDELPFTNPNGMTYDRITPLETFEHAIELLDYEAFRKEQAAARAEGRYLGVGTSTYAEPTTGGFGMYATEGATIRIEPSGAINLYVAGGSAGNSVETTAVQLAADALGVDVADVHTIQGDTAVTPYGAGTGGSRSGAMVAGAVTETAAVLRDKLARIAAHRLEAAVEDIELSGGRAHVRGVPARALTYGEIAALAYHQPDQLPPGMPAGLEASGRYTTPSPFVWANATHVCTCEVDVETGQVTLLRYIVAEDCGPMINPNVVEGQIAGGTVQGIGGVLYEHLAYDGEGNPLTSTLMDYLLPTSTEVPVIEHGHVETPGPGAGGYKGVGEGGAIGAPAAVVNAVADALSPFGVTITSLPLGPADILALVEDRR
ncbi:MAG TPA: xanthine dehydrogenase family protein molybdopterin-binding subunit [Acidimicrobiales bacterium]